MVPCRKSFSEKLTDNSRDSDSVATIPILLQTHLTDRGTLLTWPAWALLRVVSHKEQKELSLQQGRKRSGELQTGFLRYCWSKRGFEGGDGRWETGGSGTSMGLSTFLWRKVFCVDFI